MPSTDTYTLSLHDALPISPGPSLLMMVTVAAACTEGGATSAVTAVSSSPAASSRPNARWLLMALPRLRGGGCLRELGGLADRLDRKSTRLNSSHLGISYAVHRHLHSFPTRRSSDLARPVVVDDGDRRGRVYGRRSHERGHGGEQQSRREQPSECEMASHGATSPSRRWMSSRAWRSCGPSRSEEHTSELQSLRHLVCRPPTPTLFPYTTLFRSRPARRC